MKEYEKEKYLKNSTSRKKVRKKRKRKHGVKRVRIRSYSGPYLAQIFLHSDCIRRDTEKHVFSPNAGKSGKNADQNNSEYGLFLHSERK